MAIEITRQGETPPLHIPTIELSGTAAAALVKAIRLPLDYVNNPDFNDNHTGITDRSGWASVPANVFTDLVDKAAALDDSVLATLDDIMIKELVYPTTPDELLRYLERDLQDYYAAVLRSSITSQALNSMPRKRFTHTLSIILGLDYFKNYSANKDRLGVFTHIPGPEHPRVQTCSKLLELYDEEARELLPLDQRQTIEIAAYRQPLSGVILSKPYDPGATKAVAAVNLHNISLIRDND